MIHQYKGKIIAMEAGNYHGSFDIMNVTVPLYKLFKPSKTSRLRRLFRKTYTDERMLILMSLDINIDITLDILREPV